MGESDTDSKRQNSSAKTALLDVLREVRALLAHPENDFAWSTWENASEAVAELDAYIAWIETGCSFSNSSLVSLFAPTGNIQEVSLSSGWGNHFVPLAERFDSVFAEFTSPGDE
jgi:hypothetical protein